MFHSVILLIKEHKGKGATRFQKFILFLRKDQCLIPSLSHCLSWFNQR